MHNAYAMSLVKKSLSGYTVLSYCVFWTSITYVLVGFAILLAASPLVEYAKPTSNYHEVIRMNTYMYTVCTGGHHKLLSCGSGYE